MKIPTNESAIDRVVRVALGILLVAVALFGGLTAPLLYVVWVVAAIALVSGLVGFCALYALFGIATARVRR